MRKQSHFRFNKQERSGIFFLLLIVVVLQCGYYYVKANPSNLKSDFALNAVEQTKIDSLKKERFDKSQKIYPFNPNYLTDYKGYALGLSPVEFDRLFAFREQGKFVNSEKEFQAVTQVSDSLLNEISPYFKFPEWAGKSRTVKKIVSKPVTESTIKDLNTATAEDLKQVYGIGETLSERIIKFRDRLGGFLVNEQLYDVYGLEPDVVEKALLRFQVLEAPTVVKINVNKANTKELSRLVYINGSLASNIVEYRDKNGLFASLLELTQVDGFPSEKLDRIALYLSL
ncbi:helix-hairpin-helix domain-containing protein [Muricauda oceani]|uniref:Helix-hairpin-helix domain-containing protein n=1 Tax=Flagellimonas oceani TaxID=2698672 RepID=A0A6G7IXV8_9FLAO|nr:helix-hairpin-helix domain-containing protein [Allomuricauda oceani]MBW8243804.1 helix-hairpin-helix domain-containing protein [Allomuricauda oceani]QII43441.1 helix-hairpin-helix domain-containing protein [Allomuricauda oceani]